MIIVAIHLLSLSVGNSTMLVLSVTSGAFLIRLWLAVCFIVIIIIIIHKQ